jgi:hypothetical protein
MADSTATSPNVASPEQQQQQQPPSPPTTDAAANVASSESAPAAATSPPPPTLAVTPAEIEAAWATAKAKGEAASKAAATVTANAKVQYDALPREIRELKERLELAKSKLAKMEEVVTRYAGVHEPVVASDGYTYSRSAIQAYVNECKSKDLPAVSHQTKQELKPHFTDNRSLTKLVDTLKPMVAQPQPDDAQPPKPPQAPSMVAPIDG